MKLNTANRIAKLCALALLLGACSTAAPISSTPTIAFTPIPTLTAIPSPTYTPAAALGTIALDFVSLLCNAQWANGGQTLQPCPASNADHSGGYAVALDPVAEGFPPNSPVLLTIPSWNGYSSLFLRYPSFSVGPMDRFRASIQCRPNMSCDIEFALEYYDSGGKFHSPFLKWDMKAGDPPILVDVDLGTLAGQSVDFVLTLRLFHATNNPQQDNGLWIGPHIFRTLP